MERRVGGWVSPTGSNPERLFSNVHLRLYFLLLSATEARSPSGFSLLHKRVAYRSI